MRQRRWILLLIVFAFAIVTSWLWWVRPKKVDMAAYVPAEAIVYVEANEPLEVIKAIVETDAWRAFQRAMGSQANSPTTNWLQEVIRWTGIGPIESVILARAQVAAFVTDLGTTEGADTLRIKPEGAILIQTHTSEARIRAAFERALKGLAEKAYRQPVSRRVTVDGAHFIVWSAPEGSRQVVGTIIGSLLIIGNSEHSVQNCVAVTLGRQKSLKDDPQLSLVRRQLGGEHALTFGYVPPGNSARLLAISLPLLMGRAPADSEFQRVVTTSAANIFGNLGWTSRGYLTGVEDRYQITLQPQIVARLKPSFRPPNRPSQMQRLLPDDVFAATSYKFENPAATWQSLKTSVSSQVDALSTILFSTLLKSSLLSYGINDPESFLAAVDGELLTMRLDENAERSIIIGGVQDRIRMRDVITKGMGLTPRGSPNAHAEIFGDSQDEFAATFIRDLIVVGSAAEVRRFVGSVQRNAELDPAKVKRMTFFGASTTSANVVTFADDSDRVRNFISAIIATTGKPTLTSGRIEEIVDGLPYAVTETSLGDNGLERITRSPLGQFSTLLPLVVPQQLNPTKTGSESK